MIKISPKKPLTKRHPEKKQNTYDSDSATFYYFNTKFNDFKPRYYMCVPEHNIDASDIFKIPDQVLDQMLDNLLKMRFNTFECEVIQLKNKYHVKKKLIDKLRVLEAIAEIILKERRKNSHTED